MWDTRSVVAAIDWTVVVSAACGAVVGVAGVVFGWLTSNGQREHAVVLAQEQHRHDRELARDERLYADKREALEAILTFNLDLEARLASAVHGEHVSISQQDLFPPAETRSRVSALATQEIVDQVNESHRLATRVVSALEARVDVDAPWQAFSDSLTNLAQLVREELRR